MVRNGALSITWIVQPSRRTDWRRPICWRKIFWMVRPRRWSLGDNIFFGHGLPKMLARADAVESGGTVFGYRVADPERYGVLAYDGDKVSQIIEKAREPSVELCCDRGCISLTAPRRNGPLRCSLLPRGELEITDLLELVPEGR